MRLVFMGTPSFAVPTLEALIDAGHTIVGVYTQPPRPSGRGHREHKSSIHEYAESQGIAVYTPLNFKDPHAVATFQSLAPDAVVVVAYGLLLPQSILATPRYGCLNVHASLLPRWRGAAPIQRAILAGDKETGITIMQMEAGLDTGPILLQDSVPIDESTTSATLHDALATLGAQLMVTVLEELSQGSYPPQPQPDTGATYAPKIQATEGYIDWHESAAVLERKLRAFTPWPGISFTWQGQRIKILAAEIIPSTEEVAPGILINDALTVRCGTDALRIFSLQKPGGKPMDARAFLNGCPLHKGARLPSDEHAAL